MLGDAIGVRGVGADMSRAVWRSSHVSTQAFHMLAVERQFELV